MADRKPNALDLRTKYFQQQEDTRQAAIRRSPPPPPEFSAVQLREFYLNQKYKTGGFAARPRAANGRFK